MQVATGCRSQLANSNGHKVWRVHENREGQPQAHRDDSTGNQTQASPRHSEVDAPRENTCVGQLEEALERTAVEPYRFASLRNGLILGTHWGLFVKHIWPGSSLLNVWPLGQYPNSLHDLLPCLIQFHCIRLCREILSFFLAKKIGNPFCVSA